MSEVVNAQTARLCALGQRSGPFDVVGLKADLVSCVVTSKTMFVDVEPFNFFLLVDA